MPLTTVTRRSIIDVAGVLDTPLKLVTIKSSKMNNRKQQNSSKTIFRGAIIRGTIFSGAFFRGAFFPEAFFRTPILTYHPILSLTYCKSYCNKSYFNL